MAQEIHIYGGRARRGSIALFPMSKEAREQLDGIKYYNAYLSEFPEIKYSTNWGDWDKSNSAYIANKIAAFAGAGDSIPGKIVRMLAGDNYVPPILTDKWTQLSASLADGAYIELDLSLIAYPIISNDIFVEGLRKDSENLVEIVNETTSMFKWLELGKKCMMPKKAFSTGVIKDNVKAVMTAFNDKDADGKYVLNARGKQTVDGLKELGGGILNLQPGEMLKGGEKAFQGVIGVNTDNNGIQDWIGNRIGSSFGVVIRDTDNSYLLNTVTGCTPVFDFFIKDMKFKFSPHVVRIMNKDRKRVGCCPEFCEIQMSLQSVCKVLPSQIVKMCKYK